MRKNQSFRIFAATIMLALNIHVSNAVGTFYNPIRAAESPDPWVIQKDGFYYYMVTTGDGVWIHKSDKLEAVGNATRTKVWSAPEGEIKGNIWAPELHYINGKWYIYACGSINGTSNNMRMFVLEGQSQDPLGSYKYIGLLNGSASCIDADVWQDPASHKIYMAWSQWDPDQSIFIAEMPTPTTLSATKVKLSAPTAPWEVKGWNVNEGPAFIKHNNKLHIVFSVSGCSTSDYALAKLTCSNGDYLNASAWTKSTGPIFSRNESNKVWGVGHHAFTKSPDGTEDWLIYHAKASQIYSNADRSSRIQIFTWDANDNPVLGEPYPINMKIPCPSNGIGTKQTISFDLIPTKTVNDESFAPIASASSGLPIIYRIQNGPASIVNGKIVLTGTPGTVKIWAMQEGNGTFNATWPVYREFKVTSTSEVPGSGNGLIGTYYNGTKWETKVLDRTDLNISFDWGLNSPAMGINADNFSVKWKGYILPLYSDVYNFSLISDNGRKLIINNTIIIDHLNGDWGKEYVGSISLVAGKQYPIEIDYVEETGNANIKMYWWSSNQTKKIVPKSQLNTTILTDIDHSSASIKPELYPNPAANSITFCTPNAMNDLFIFNSYGILVQSYQAKGASELTCNVENLPCGVYFIKAKCNNSIYTEKMIIKR